MQVETNFDFVLIGAIERVCEVEVSRRTVEVHATAMHDRIIKACIAIMLGFNDDPVG
jgi:hypothetical protein